MLLHPPRKVERFKTWTGKQPVGNVLSGAAALLHGRDPNEGDHDDSNGDDDDDSGPRWVPADRTVVQSTQTAISHFLPRSVALT